MAAVEHEERHAADAELARLLLVVRATSRAYASPARVVRTSSRRGDLGGEPREHLVIADRLALAEVRAKQRSLSGPAARARARGAESMRVEGVARADLSKWKSRPSSAAVSVMRAIIASACATPAPYCGPAAPRTGPPPGPAARTGRARTIATPARRDRGGRTAREPARGGACRRDTTGRRCRTIHRCAAAAW